MSIFRKFADHQLLSENSRLAEELSQLRHELAEERSRVRILELEQETLLDVIQRDRHRVQAESMAYAAAIADSERKGKG